jgi:integrase
MSLHFVKAKGSYCFSFKRVIDGKLIRATKLLPKAWNTATCNAYDLKETARLYALHSGVAEGVSSRPKIEDAVLLYLEEHLKDMKSKSAYLSAYKVLYPLYAGKYLDELPAVCIKINSTDNAPATRRRKIMMLCSACTYAYKVHNLGAQRYSNKVELPTVKNNRVNPIDRATMLRLCRVSTKQLRVAILTAFYSGMRKGEILRAVVNAGVFEIHDTKNGSSRSIPMHTKLQVYSKRFPMKYHYDTMSLHWNKARELLGLQHFHFHDLRHSCATELINNGADLYTVALILGHENLASTKRYAHKSVDRLRAAIQGISRK